MIFERDDQLSDLRQLFSECRHRKGRMAVISGPTATGKTTLLNTFADEIIAGGATFLSASGSCAERAVPFGVLGQLFRSAWLPDDRAARVSWLMREAAGAPFVPPVVHHGLSMELLDLVERFDGPLLIGVDDADMADAASLRCLSALVRRARSGVLIVLTETVGTQAGRPLLQAELPREPFCRWIGLNPLSGAGTAAMLAAYLGPDRARDIAADCQAITGGNPLLVRALIEDNDRDTAESAGPVVGCAFANGVLSCLHICDASMRQVARGLAVLAEPRPARLLGRLIGMEPEAVARATAALNTCGVLDDGWFRHPAAASAVLDGIPVVERVDLHQRAARLLSLEVGSATAVARQLVLAGTVEPDQLPVLHEAAERALDEDDVELALACLGMARQAGDDDRGRAVTAAILARAQWRTDPIAAAAHLPELIAAARAGHLADRHTFVLVQLLAWFGQAARARALLAVPPVSATGRLDAHRTALTCLFPPVLKGTEPEVRAFGPIREVLTRGPSTKVVAAAERILPCVRLDDHNLMDTLGALGALLFGNRLADAETWCDRLLEEVADRGAPTWRALLAALRAEIALRRGDLGAAERYGRLALTAISARSWGIGIGLPIGTLVRACVAAGRSGDSFDYLRIPVPEAMLSSTVGVFYLRARGLHQRAAGRYAAALDDFDAVGDLMARWGLDSPKFAPWRTDAAQTWLRLGDAERARALATQQRELCDRADTEYLAVATRVVAATRQPKDRVGLLVQAVEALQGCGARLELAHTLSDLGWTYHELGRRTPAKMVLHSADLIAKQCGAEEPGRTLGSDPTGAEPSPRGEVAAGDKLSDAETRVATLASWGYSNRQIASKLFITISTVEQHLTRTYRKLNVSRRSDLALGLYSDVSDSR